MSGLHIVMVPAWWPSPEQPGAGVFFASYVECFAAAGARVGVIYPDLVSLRYCRRGTRIPLVPRIEHETCHGCPVVRIRGLHTAFAMPPVQMHRFRRWLRRGLAEYRARHGSPDVLHAMCAIPSAWACTALPDPLARRVVITEHTGPFSLVLGDRKGERFVRRAIASAGALVAVSDHSARQMRAAGIDRDIRICGNPVASVFSSRPPAVGKQRTPLAALFAGRLVGEKGVLEIGDAAADLARDHEIDWHFAGTGPLEEVLRRRFAASGLAGRLTLHGQLTGASLADLMAGSDFLVLPTHGEIFGLAVAEALCMGLPVVTTCGTACEDFVGPDDGLCVDPGDAASLAAGIRALIRRLPEFDRGAIAARARRRFAGGCVADFYTAVFRSIIG
jgi:glycosyltransferase involved in cell wall biosynthesis